MGKLFMMDFPTDQIKLNVCYKNKELIAQIEESSSEKKTIPKILDVYGPLIFPESPQDRPYIMSSIVLSSDGKMAFSDMPAGPVIAKNNFLDPDGALADFWVLNAMRTYCDGIILGAKTLQTEEDNTSHIFDREMASQRTNVLKKKPHPMNIVVSFDGSDIPLDHKIFNVNSEEQFQVALATSPDGCEFLKKNFKKPIEIIGPFESLDDFKSDIFNPDEYAERINNLDGVIPVFITGEGSTPDSSLLLKLLRLIGMKKLLIESPSYTSHLISKGELDEFFINYSMVIAGGMITPGSALPFSYKNHPHLKLLTVATHRANFIYTRQKLYYGLDSTGDLSEYKY